MKKRTAKFHRFIRRPRPLERDQRESLNCMRRARVQNKSNQPGGDNREWRLAHPTWQFTVVTAIGRFRGQATISSREAMWGVAPVAPLQRRERSRRRPTPYYRGQRRETQAIQLPGGRKLR